MLHLLGAGSLAFTAWLLMGTAPVRATDWGIAAGVLLAAAFGLLWLEQRWAEDVNLAFFKTNVWVGFVVLAMVLAARMAAGGF